MSLSLSFISDGHIAGHIAIPKWEGNNSSSFISELRLHTCSRAAAEEVFSQAEPPPPRGAQIGREMRVAGCSGEDGNV
jgi:hypothetical protein